MAEQGGFETINDSIVNPGADALWAEAAEWVRDDQAIEFGQAALLCFELEQIGEGRCADGDGWDAKLFEEDCGVDTPRRA